MAGNMVELHIPSGTRWHDTPLADIQTVVKESGPFEKALDIRGHGAMRQAARTSHRPLFACISLARHHTASAMSADVKSIGNPQEKSNRETQE